MYITNINLKNFRCLSPYNITIESPIVLITGPNGTGKTSIIEALYYACYLRSFRTYIPRELIRFQETSFVINVSFNAYIGQETINHDLHIGFDRKKKLVKIDGKSVQTYKDLLEYYRVISITNDDIQLISGGPHDRRIFIDQALSLLDPGYISELKTYKTIIQNKNALLKNSFIDESLYHLWNKQLWQKTRYIQEHRKKLVNDLQARTNKLLQSFFNHFSIDIEYKSLIIKQESSYEEFITVQKDLPIKEQIMQRSLFGAHLDDISLKFDARQSKNYASRGQQKLMVFMLKAALTLYVSQSKGKISLLLDDFMGDFDQQVLHYLHDLLNSLDCQLILTSPTNKGHLEKKLLMNGSQEIKLTHCK